MLDDPIERDWGGEQGAESRHGRLQGRGEEEIEVQISEDREDEER